MRAFGVGVALLAVLMIGAVLALFLWADSEMRKMTATLVGERISV